MRDRYKFVDEDGIYFVTSTIIKWLPVFTNRIYFDIIIESLKYCIENKALDLYAYVILDNHFHLIVSGPNLSDFISSLKKFTARKIIDQSNKDGKEWFINQFSYYKKKYKSKSTRQVWQEGVHPELISSDQMFRQKMEYMLFNPVERGYVSAPEHWLFSSARNYILDDDSVISIQKPVLM